MKKLKKYLYLLFLSDSDIEQLDAPVEPPKYHDVLDEVSKSWLLLEIKHKMSKVASEECWRLAALKFQELHHAKVSEMVAKKIPQFQNQRNKLYSKEVPAIHLKIGYQNRETKAITVVESETTPLSIFKSSEYQKIFEVAYVKVNLFICDCCYMKSFFSALKKSSHRGM